MFTFGEAVGSFYSRYFDFEGRSQRSEYWWFQLYFYAILMVLGIIFIGLSGDIEANDVTPAASIALIILGLFWLGHAIGLIALAVRRFHDLGQTGWLVLVFAIASLIPLIGLLASLGQLIWFMLPGTVGPNKYGPDPLHGDQADIFE